MTRILLTTLLLTACAAPATEADVARAMERYQEAARAVDADAIAACFTEDGVLFEPGIQPIESRAAIRAFIASFPGVRVDLATATPDAIELHGRTAYLWGSYHEKLAFPGQPDSEQRGRFVAQWERESDGVWRIRRLYRVPLPGGALQ